MKKTTLIKCLLAGISIIIAGGCKKHSDLQGQNVSVNPTNLDPVLNPIIAHVVCDYDFNDTTLTNHGWKKTFDDDFSGDLSKWTLWHGGGLQNELQCYQPENLKVENGILQINAKKETVTGPKTISNDSTQTFNYTSGGLQSKTPISADSENPKVKLVARVKVAHGYGLASAFWSYGNNWPQNGEIDVMEARGDDATKYFTDFFYGPDVNKNVVPIPESYVSNRTDGDLSTCYHVYETEWDQHVLVVKVDGQVIETKSSAYVASLFGKTQYVTLNLAVGGLLYNTLNAANIENGTLYVDYVKVFISK